MYFPNLQKIIVLINEYFRIKLEEYTLTEFYQMNYDRLPWKIQMYNPWEQAR